MFDCDADRALWLVLCTLDENARDNLAQRFRVMSFHSNAQVVEWNKNACEALAEFEVILSDNAEEIAALSAQENLN